MAIILSWSNRGQAVTAVNIYRSGRRSESPTLLAELNTAVESYTDDTSSRNTIYYYQVGLVIGGSEVKGAVIPAAEVSDPGPGPQTLISGTWEWGYFGKLTPDEFFTSATLRTLCPLVWSAYGTAISYWRKYALRGKVIYLPDVPIYQFTATAQSAITYLYNAGLLYGNGRSDKPPLISSGLTVLQNKKATLNGYEFYIRAPYGAASIDPITGMLSDRFTDYYQSEGMLLVMDIGNWKTSPINMLPTQFLPRISPQEAMPPAIDIITQHLYSSATVVKFPRTGNDVSVFSSSQIIGYLPVLELIAS